MRTIIDSKFSLNPYFNEIKMMIKVGIEIAKEKENDEQNIKIIMRDRSILFLNLFRITNRNIISVKNVLKNTLICMPQSKFSKWFHEKKYMRVVTKDRFFNFTKLLTTS